MKLLLYGGCHAVIIKRLIDELGPAHRHQVECLVNFQLINSGKSFPYESLPAYDAVIYSPISNKGEYNTSFLDEACLAANVQAIRFPWLEWHGYAPSAQKKLFWGHHGWYFPELVSSSCNFTNFDDFVYFALNEFPSYETIKLSYEYSTNRIIDQEIGSKCEIRVSDFILKNYQDRRLFLIPDHPTTYLYQYILNEIEALVGTPLVAAWPSNLPELQPEERTPILPRIASEMGLTFNDTSWCSETQPLSAMDVNAFLALHFEAGRERHQERMEGSDVVLATACRPTWASSVARGPDVSTPVDLPIFTQVLMRRWAIDEGSDHFTGDVLAALSGHGGGILARRLGGLSRFRTGDWIFRS
ncbi:WcbI family polysaccharide biosynthesis putative acetyltransferase [Methylobacterium sp. J-026]|uniref:WcbI family polysaccharide biosynthesis putative acetyltransferase n=1 Tax=Methylobacterium sp. J-026 TaxID=2836624 RepID=UPI001FB8C08A|nr:WcbI family polysaccharide biosynthesis putative acetyltransferase [Methylobacterium sp. J-026]MCJ2136715.1 WcbI family polysaccharide biosynthesis putative acetyltransferase [Methylobacterium sp. J-026]